MFVPSTHISFNNYKLEFFPGFDPLTKIIWHLFLSQIGDNYADCCCCPMCRALKKTARTPGPLCSGHVRRYASAFISKLDKQGPLAGQNRKVWRGGPRRRPETTAEDAGLLQHGGRTLHAGFPVIIRVSTGASVAAGASEQPGQRDICCRYGRGIRSAWHQGTTQPHGLV